MRIGWSIPLLPVNFTLLHGPLMVGGFLGTVISLERAVAYKKAWAYIAPLFCGIGSIILWFESINWISPVLIFIGSLVLVSIFIQFIRINPGFDLTIMTIASGIWAVSNFFWILGWPVYILSQCWILFLVLTITAERMQLSGILPKSLINKSIFQVAFILSLFSMTIGFFNFDYASRFLAVGLLLFGIWLLSFDITKKSIHKPGLSRFIAVCLISGYVWLVVSAILIFIFSIPQGGLIYDAILHSIFLGFVFSMIFGHAPIIFPAIIGLPINFTNRFYVHLILLHISLIVRIYADLSDWLIGRYWAGMFNSVAIIIFLISTIFQIISHQIYLKKK